MLNLPRILALIDLIAQQRVLFIGETIIDEYRFVSAMGKPSKENILAVRMLKSEVYQGGVIAAKKHASYFCEIAQLTVGNEIRKVRYVEENYTRKLFEVQQIEDAVSIEPIPVDLLARFEKVVVTDFGHCMFFPPVIKQLCDSDKWLAVATQTNSHNAGYNLITKWPRADYICIDEPEARLAASDRYSTIEMVMRHLMRNRCGKMIVSHGRHGAYGLDETGFHHMPAFTNTIIDTMGAGDAFFAITALMAKEAHIEDLLAIGNAAGALKTQIIGHRSAVTKDALIEYLKAHGTC